MQPHSTRYTIVDDYDKNWTDIMGKNAWFWFLPLPATDMTCDGYNWVIYPKVIRVWLIIIKLNDIRAFRITYGN